MLPVSSTTSRTCVSISSHRKNRLCAMWRAQTYMRSLVRCSYYPETCRSTVAMVQRSVDRLAVAVRTAIIIISTITTAAATHHRILSFASHINNDDDCLPLPATLTDAIFIPYWQFSFAFPFVYFRCNNITCESKISNFTSMIVCY